MIYIFAVTALSLRLVVPYFMMILLFFYVCASDGDYEDSYDNKMMVLVMITLKIIQIKQYIVDDYIFAVPALSVRLVVPPSPIVAGRLYTVDCQVDSIF